MFLTGAYGKFEPENMRIGEVIEIGQDIKGFTLGELVAGYRNLKPTHIMKQGIF
jgi:hypothetical protein